MASKKKKFHFPKKITFLPIFLSLLLFISSIAAYEVVLADKYYPFTYVGDTHISFLSKGQAIRKFQGKLDGRLKKRLQFAYAQGSFEIDMATSLASLDYSIFDS